MKIKSGVEFCLVLEYLKELRRKSFQKAIRIQHLTNYFQSVDYQKKNSKLFPVSKYIHNKKEEYKGALLPYKLQLIKFPYHTNLSMYNFLPISLCYNIFEETQLFFPFSTPLSYLKNMPSSLLFTRRNLAIDFYTPLTFDFIVFAHQNFSLCCGSGWLLNSWLDSATAPFLHFYKRPNTISPQRAITIKPIILAVPGTYLPTKIPAIIKIASKNKLTAIAGNNSNIEVANTTSPKANPGSPDRYVPIPNTIQIFLFLFFYIPSRDKFSYTSLKVESNNSQNTYPSLYAMPVIGLSLSPSLVLISLIVTKKQSYSLPIRLQRAPKNKVGHDVNAVFSNEFIKFSSYPTVIILLFIKMTVYYTLLQQKYDKKQFCDSNMEIVSSNELNFLLTYFGTISLPLTQFVSRCWEVKQ